MTKTLALLIASGTLTTSAFATTPIVQDFETGTTPGNPLWNAPTVASGAGTLGVTSSGGNYHAEATGGNYTQHNGYDNSWDGGFIAKLDVYVDLNQAANGGYQFDLTQAISQDNSGTPDHLRDFYFNVNTTTDDMTVWADSSTGATNVGGNFIRGGGLGGTPFQFTSSGWYTLEWKFYEDAGLLNVDTSIDGTFVHSFSPSSANDVIAGTLATGLPVSSHRYMWFVNAGQTTAIDNSTIAAIPEPTSLTLLGLASIGLMARRRRA